MNRKEFAKRVSAEMRRVGKRKRVRTPKHVLHISDDYGHHKDFVVRQTDSNILYSAEDVEAMLDTCIDVIQECIREGEQIVLRGVGTLGTKYRKPHAAVDVTTGKAVMLEGRYFPKFNPSPELKAAAKTYGDILEERIPPIEPYYTEDEYADEEPIEGEEEITEETEDDFTAGEVEETVWD